MQEVVNSHSLATVDWVELQWLARVAMLNIEPVEATESAFDVGTGKVIEVPAAHQRIVLGVDSTRGVQVSQTDLPRSFSDFPLLCLVLAPAGPVPSLVPEGISLQRIRRMACA